MIIICLLPLEGILILGVIRSKPKESIWPITTCGGEHQWARVHKVKKKKKQGNCLKHGKTCLSNPVTLCWSLETDWMRGWLTFLQDQSKLNKEQKQSNLELLLSARIVQISHKCLKCYLNYTYLISCSLELSCCCIFISVFTSCLLMVWSCLTTCPIWLWSVVTNVYNVFTCTVNSPTLEWRLLWKEHEKRIWFPVIVRI